MKYEVTIACLANYTAQVEADSEEDAIDMVEDKYAVADSGEFEIFDGEVVSAEVI